MHDLLDAYNLSISTATNEFFDVISKAWDVQQAKITAAGEVFEKARADRMALFYAGAPALPKAGLPQDVADKIRAAVEQATAIVGDDDVQKIAAE